MSLKINEQKQIIRILIKASIVLSAILVFAIGVYYINKPAVAGTTGFMAGRIIDDGVFTKYGSMSVSQIQNFLNGKVPTCDTNGTQISEYGGPDLNGDGKVQRWEWGKHYYNQTTFTCLRNYSQNGKSAAQIIHDAAQQYKINPQVILVLLQKEQGLIQDTWPLNIQYRSATGYGCPDTAACDTQYYGFTNQVKWAATMFRAIMDNSPTWYTPYVLGNNYIQYNPNSSCGGSTIYIQNRATQALYNYTPYQPNKATLDAGWGTASCGAYGNRNFYLYFTKWFGATTSAATYGFSTVSVEAFSDYTYQNKIQSPILVTPGQEFWVKVVLKNTGNQVWYNDLVRLGTYNPKDRISPFYVSTEWINKNRPTAMSESFVLGGNNGTFTFKAKAPTSLGTYDESFGVVIEQYRWLSQSFTVPITVTSPDPYYSVQTTSFKAYADSAMTKEINTSNIKLYTDSEIYIKTVIKNTGNRTFPANLTKIATTNPADRLSLYSSDSWLEQNRPTSSPSDIAPQSSSSLTFKLKAPSTPLSLQTEQFGLVIENQRWLSNNIGSLSIQTDQRPPASISSGYINKGELLLSGNEGYKLVFQTDGNLVLYSPKRAVWATWTIGKNASKLVMQSDGNMVIYSSDNRPLWHTRTSGKGPSTFAIQNDGNMVIYDQNNKPTWASWTIGAM